jgi:phenylpropionate dioxygenase-like ring-hydroxylating dioxygenase large terminal subunit
MMGWNMKQHSGDDHSDWNYLVQPNRVHRSIYTDPALFRAEMERIFARTWFFVGHESEVPEPGSFVTRSIGRRPFILTRTRDGQLRLLFNRCTHRGTTLCRAESGKARFFTCPYHGWTFDNAGGLAGMPHPEGFEGDQMDGRWNLGGAARVESYRGMIFASLTDAVPDLAVHLRNVRPYIDRFFDRSPVGPLAAVNGMHKMEIRANWKTCFDNSTDGYHAETAHRSILEVTRKRYGGSRSLSYVLGKPDDGPMYQLALGNGHTFFDQFPAMGDLWDRVRPAPGLEPIEDAVAALPDGQRMLRDIPGPGVNLNLFPNMITIGNQLVMIEPLAVDRFLMIWYATSIDGAPPEINSGRMRIAEDFPNFGEPDDIDCWEQMQFPLGIPEMEWLDMSRGLATDVVDHETGVIRGRATSDTGMRGYYREYKRLMAGAGTN